MKNILKIAVLCALTGVSHAAGLGDEVIVIYNTRMPESKSVAEHYAERRQVPANQVFGFAVSTNEAMSRAQYQDTLAKPLAKELEERKLWHVGSDVLHGTNGAKDKVVWKVLHSKIRYAVLCYGIPVRIDPDSSVKETVDESMIPELRKNGAAVDSELALLPLIEQNYTLTGPIKNNFFTLTNAALFQPTNGLLMVTRLDGPSADIARGLVDKAIEAESNSLCGIAYFDLRSIGTNSPYHLGDDWILGAAKICQYYGGYQTIMDTNAATFPADSTMSQIAFYCGWYDEHASGPFAQPTVEFMPGAFAYHLHSFSASTIRSTTQRWVGPFLAKGAAATMGCVDEPYLAYTPDISIFTGRWIAMGFTYGEAAYACQETLSWQTTVIGDPLYQPFAKPLQKVIEEQEKANSKSLEWTYLRVVNIALLSGKRPVEMANFLQSVPVTKQSAVLSEKLGDLYYDMGKPSSAVEAYQNCIDHVQSRLQRVRVRQYLANILTGQNKIKEAVDDLKSLLQEVPDYPGKGNVEKKIQDLTTRLDNKTAGAAH